MNKSFQRRITICVSLCAVVFESSTGVAANSIVTDKISVATNAQTVEQTERAQDKFIHFIVGGNLFRISCDYHTLLYYKGKKAEQCGNDENSPITTNLVSVDTRFYKARKIRNHVVNSWMKDLYPSLVYIYEFKPRHVNAEAFNRLRQQYTLPQPLSRLPREDKFFVFRLGPNDTRRFYIAATKEGLTPKGLPLTFRCIGPTECSTRYILEPSIPIRYRFSSNFVPPPNEWLALDQKVRAFVLHLYVGPVK